MLNTNNNVKCNQLTTVSSSAFSRALWFGGIFSAGFNWVVWKIKNIQTAAYQTSYVRLLENIKQPRVLQKKKTSLRISKNINILRGLSLWLPYKKVIILNKGSADQNETILMWFYDMFLLLFLSIILKIINLTYVYLILSKNNQNIYIKKNYLLKVELKF